MLNEILNALRRGRSRGRVVHEIEAALTESARQAADEAERPKARKKRDDARRRKESEAVAASARIEARRKKRVEADAAREEVYRDLAIGDAEDMSILWRLDHLEDTADGFLRKTADVRISELADWCLNEIQTTNQAGHGYEERGFEDAEMHERYGQLQRRVRKFFSNGKAIADRTAALRAARESCEELKLEVLSEEMLLKRLEAIRASVPAADTLQAMQLVA